jgi:hypothetical protein
MILDLRIEDEDDDEDECAVNLSDLVIGLVLLLVLDSSF